MVLPTPFQDSSQKDVEQVYRGRVFRRRESASRSQPLGNRNRLFRARFCLKTKIEPVAFDGTCTIGGTQGERRQQGARRLNCPSGEITSKVKTAEGGRAGPLDCGADEKEEDHLVHRATKHRKANKGTRPTTPSETGTARGASKPPILRDSCACGSQAAVAEAAIGERQEKRNKKKPTTDNRASAPRRFQFTPHILPELSAEQVPGRQLAQHHGSDSGRRD